MIDFDNISQNFILEEQLRDDLDSSVTRKLIEYFEMARSNLDDTSLDSGKRKLMNNALLAAQDVLPTIWESMHPNSNW